MATDPWGIDDGYWDALGKWHRTSPETVAALREAMGADNSADAPPPNGPAVWVVHAGRAEPLLGPCELALEDGSELRAEGELPPDLPIGYHELRPLAGGPATRLIVTPGRCHLPGELRTWLLTVQLPGCRSAGSWGIGDLADLRSIGAWAAEQGAGMLGVSPMHAPNLVAPVEASPYFPSSRRWFNPLLLRIEELPGAGDTTVEALGAEARRLNAAPVVDRDAVWALKRRALGHLWTALGPDLRFERWREQMGSELETYARFCALAEHHGTGWRAWPTGHRHPSGADVASFAADHADRVAFWAWVQFLVDEQLRRAEEPLALLTDLAVGVDPDGADAWCLQDLLAHDVRVGAPPDEFNRAGQDWGLPPFVPHALRAVAYEPLAVAVAGGDGTRRRPAHRPCHGPVPTVLAAARRLAHRWRLRALPGGRAAGGPGNRERAFGGGGGRRGPGHGRGGRTGPVARRRAAVVPARLVRGGRARALPGPGSGRGHHPRPAHDRRRVVGRRCGRPAGGGRRTRRSRARAAARQARGVERAGRWRSGG